MSSSLDKIIKEFIKHQRLDESIINKIVYDKAILEELSRFEPILIDALYECYLSSDLVVREEGKSIIIKTPHNLKKYLGIKDLYPLYLPLFNKIKEEKQ